MKKAIFRKFVWMILLALVVSSTVFCMAMSRKSLKNTEKQMVDTLHMMDYALDYEENLEQQIADKEQEIADTQDSLEKAKATEEWQYECMVIRVRDMIGFAEKVENKW